jgi:hypothetical protein
MHPVNGMPYVTNKVQNIRMMMMQLSASSEIIANNAEKESPVKSKKGGLGEQPRAQLN